RSSLFFSPALLPPQISTLSLHDALPIFDGGAVVVALSGHEPRGAAVALIYRHREAEMHALLRAAHLLPVGCAVCAVEHAAVVLRSEEHTSELQSRENLVCRLLLEKKNKK